MALIVGRFEKQDQAEQALLRLRDAGIEQEEAVLIANNRTIPDAAEARAAAAEAEQRVSAEGAPADPAGPEDTAVVTTSEEDTDRAVNSAALGGALGLFIGGGLMGPLGLALGVVAGTGVALAAVLAGRGLSKEEAQQYEADVLAGRYLVAVETDRRPPEEVRALLEASGVEQVRIES